MRLVPVHTEYVYAFVVAKSMDTASLSVCSARCFVGDAFSVNRAQVSKTKIGHAQKWSSEILVNNKREVNDRLT